MVLMNYKYMLLSFSWPTAQIANPSPLGLFLSISYTILSASVNLGN